MGQKRRSSSQGLVSCPGPILPVEKLSLKEFLICSTEASGLPGSPDPRLMGVSGLQARAEDSGLWGPHSGWRDTWDQCSGWLR